MADEFRTSLGRQYLEEQEKGFKDIEELKGQELLTNVVLSSNPCPDCQQASGMSMTYDEWEGSEFGLPGSAGRICFGDCHCILAPETMKADLPALDEEIKLRGDKDTDISAIVEIGPDEAGLKKLMENYYKAGNAKLPKEIYDMDFEDIGPYLKKLMGKT